MAGEGCPEALQVHLASLQLYRGMFATPPILGSSMRLQTILRRLNTSDASFKMSSLQNRKH